LNVEEV